MGRRSVIEKFEEATTGQLRVTTSEEQGPDIICKAVKIKAAAGNSDNIYVGFATGIKSIQAADDTAVGWELDAGDEMPWVFVSNMQELFFIAGAVDQDLVYWVRD